MRKKTIILFLSTAMLLSACGAEKKEEVVTYEADTETSMDENIDTSEQIDTEPVYEDEASKQTFETVLGEFDNTKDAYTALIKYMIDNNVEITPNKEFAESYAETIAGNKFAILDIDGDNEDELIIDWTNPNAMVGFTSFVFQYDVNTKTWMDELETGGSLTFYNNGVLYAGDAHNQGYGEMWPYSILKYNPSNDKYESIGHVYSEDKDRIISSCGDDSFYPSEYDPTDCGTVYIFGAESMGYEDGYHTQEEFNEFQNTLVGDASVVQIDYKNITKENLDKQ